MSTGLTRQSAHQLLRYLGRVERHWHVRPLTVRQLRIVRLARISAFANSVSKTGGERLMKIVLILLRYRVLTSKQKNLSKTVMNKLLQGRVPEVEAIPAHKNDWCGRCIGAHASNPDCTYESVAR